VRGRGARWQACAAPAHQIRWRHGPRSRALFAFRRALEIKPGLKAARVNLAAAEKRLQSR